MPRDRIRIAGHSVPRPSGIKKTYQPDLDCYEKIIVEIKAVSELTDDHRAQIHNDLKATGYRLGYS
jgi:GxxExxY protein